VDLDQLLDMNSDELDLAPRTCPARRFQRGLKRKPLALHQEAAQGQEGGRRGDKPEAVRSHLCEHDHCA